MKIKQSIQETKPTSTSTQSNQYQLQLTANGTHSEILWLSEQLNQIGKNNKEE